MAQGSRRKKRALPSSLQSKIQNSKFKIPHLPMSLIYSPQAVLPLRTIGRVLGRVAAIILKKHFRSERVCQDTFDNSPG
jgi:hypothetical protein